MKIRPNPHSQSGAQAAHKVTDVYAAVVHRCPPGGIGLFSRPSIKQGQQGPIQVEKQHDIKVQFDIHTAHLSLSNNNNQRIRWKALFGAIIGSTTTTTSEINK